MTNNSSIMRRQELCGHKRESPFHVNIIKAFDIDRFYTKEALFFWANLGEHSVVHLVICL